MSTVITDWSLDDVTVDDVNNLQFLLPLQLITWPALHQYAFSNADQTTATAMTQRMTVLCLLFWQLFCV